MTFSQQLITKQITLAQPRLIKELSTAIKEISSRKQSSSAKKEYFNKITIPKIEVWLKEVKESKNSVFLNDKKSVHISQLIDLLAEPLNSTHADLDFLKKLFCPLSQWHLFTHSIKLLDATGLDNNYNINLLIENIEHVSLLSKTLMMLNLKLTEKRTQLLTSEEKPSETDPLNLTRYISSPALATVTAALLDITHMTEVLLSNPAIIEKLDHFYSQLPSINDPSFQTTLLNFIGDGEICFIIWPKFEALKLPQPLAVDFLKTTSVNLLSDRVINQLIESPQVVLEWIASLCTAHWYDNLLDFFPIIPKLICKDRADWLPLLNVIMQLKHLNLYDAELVRRFLKTPLHMTSIDDALTSLSTHEGLQETQPEEYKSEETSFFLNCGFPNDYAGLMADLTGDILNITTMTQRLLVATPDNARLLANLYDYQAFYAAGEFLTPPLLVDFVKKFDDEQNWPALTAAKAAIDDLEYFLPMEDKENPPVLPVRIRNINPSITHDSETSESKLPLQPETKSILYAKEEGVTLPPCKILGEALANYDNEHTFLLNPFKKDADLERIRDLNTAVLEANRTTLTIDQLKSLFTLLLETKPDNFGMVKHFKTQLLRSMGKELATIFDLIAELPQTIQKPIIDLVFKNLMIYPSIIEIIKQLMKLENCVSKFLLVCETHPTHIDKIIQGVQLLLDSKISQEKLLGYLNQITEESHLALSYAQLILNDLLDIPFSSIEKIKIGESKELASAIKFFINIGINNPVLFRKLIEKTDIDIQSIVLAAKELHQLSNVCLLNHLDLLFNYSSAAILLARAICIAAPNSPDALQKYQFLTISYRIDSHLLKQIIADPLSDLTCVIRMLSQMNLDHTHLVAFSHSNTLHAKTVMRALADLQAAILHFGFTACPTEDEHRLIFNDLKDIQEASQSIWDLKSTIESLGMTTLSYVDKLQSKFDSFEKITKAVQLLKGRKLRNEIIREELPRLIDNPQETLNLVWSKPGNLLFFSHRRTMDQSQGSHAFKAPSFY
jgi:hypothetical protein